LLFAEKYTELVERMFLYSTFLARYQDIDWMFNGSKIFYQDLYDELGNNDVLYSNYYDNLGCLDVELEKEAYKNSKSMDIFIRFYKNNFFIDENQIMENVDKIKNIPTMILHSRLDFSAPVSQSITLSKKLDNSTLIIVPELGHFGKQMKEAIKNKTSFLED
jgi:proline iminopeptidase